MGLTRIGQDDYHAISFSPGREDLTECHLEPNQVDLQYRPLPELLSDHLAQGVWRCCLFLGGSLINCDNQQQADLDLSTEEGMIAVDYAPQEDDLADTGTLLITGMQEQPNGRSRCAI
jgi:hypothetical protein